MQSLNDEQNIDSQKLLFCQKCLGIPHFSLEVESNGNIFLCHLCDKNKIKKNSELLKKEENIEKRCYICDSKSNFVCIKCNLIICEKCFKIHDNFILIEEDIYDNKNNIHVNEENEHDDKDRVNKLISIFELQFICKKHTKTFSHYCQVCQKNLCDDCLIFHEHINNIKFGDIIKKEKKIESLLETKGDTPTTNKFLKISKMFSQCFNSCKTNQKINIDIILNYLLILEIQNFIQDKKETGVICNKFILENNRPCYSKYFFDKDFVSYYERLILDIESGNINSFHSLNNIKSHYINHNEIYLNNYKSLKKRYLLKLSILEIDLKSQILFVKDMIKTAQYNYSLIEIAKLYEELYLQNNMLEYNFELIKKLSLQMIYKVDFQLRRKISNLITKELFNNFYSNIQELNTTPIRLSKCSSELKNKFISLDKNRNTTNELNNYKNEIKSKYINSLEPIKTNVSNGIKNNEIDGIKEEKNDIIFINLNEGDEEYLKAVYLIYL